MKGGESQTLPKWQEVATCVSWTMTKADAAKLNGAVKRRNTWDSNFNYSDSLVSEIPSCS